MERSHELDPDDEDHIYALHYVFVEIIRKQLQMFTESWNMHGLRTEGDKTPLQLFISGLHLVSTSAELADDGEIPVCS